MADSEFKVEFSYEELLELGRKADAGDYQAMLGYILYGNGFFVSERDPEMDAVDDKVSEYLKKLEDSKDSYAFLTLGDAYLAGDYGLEHDLQKAYRFYEKAIEVAEKPGDATPAYAALGDAFYFGKGKEQNYKESFARYKIAAANTTHGRYMLAESYRLGRGIRKNLKLALKYYEKCANIEHYNDHPTDPYCENACYRVAQAYHYGWGTEVNMELAQKYIDTIAPDIDEHSTYVLVTKEDLQAEYDAIYKDFIKIEMPDILID